MADVVVPATADAGAPAADDLIPVVESATEMGAHAYSAVKADIASVESIFAAVKSAIVQGQNVTVLADDARHRLTVAADDQVPVGIGPGQLAGLSTSEQTGGLVMIDGDSSRRFAAGPLTAAAAYAAVKAIIAAGTNVTAAADDDAHTITLAASGGGGGSADGVIDGLTMSVSGQVLTVTISRSVGADITQTVTLPTGGGGSATPLSDATPQAPGTAAAGSSGDASRADHVHPRQSVAWSDVTGRPTIPSVPARAGAFTAAAEAKLDGIAAGAEVNPQVVSQADAEAGTSTAERTWTAQRVAQAIAALAPGGSSGTSDGVVDGVEAEVSGDELTITLSRTVGADLSDTVALPAGGSSVLSSLAPVQIDGESSNVAVGTTGTDYRDQTMPSTPVGLSAVQADQGVVSDLDTSADTVTVAAGSYLVVAHLSGIFNRASSGSTARSLPGLAVTGTLPEGGRVDQDATQYFRGADATDPATEFDVHADLYLPAAATVGFALTLIDGLEGQSNVGYQAVVDSIVLWPRGGDKGDPGDGVPDGGTAGQVLAKASAADQDTEWVDQSGGGGSSPWADAAALIGDIDDDTGGDIDFTAEGSGAAANLRGIIRPAVIERAMVDSAFAAELGRIPDDAQSSEAGHVWTAQSDGSGDWEAPSGGGAATPLSDDTPAGPGTASAGTGDEASRADHVHPRQTGITAAEIAAGVIPTLPTDAQIGDAAFSNPPSDLTADERTAVRTAIGAGTGSGGGGGDTGPLEDRVEHLEELTSDIREDITRGWARATVSAGSGGPEMIRTTSAAAPTTETAAFNALHTTTGATQFTLTASQTITGRIVTAAAGRYRLEVTIGSEVSYRPIRAGSVVLIPDDDDDTSITFFQLPGSAIAADLAAAGETSATVTLQTHGGVTGHTWTGDIDPDSLGPLVTRLLPNAANQVQRRLARSWTDASRAETFSGSTIPTEDIVESGWPTVVGRLAIWRRWTNSTHRVIWTIAQFDGGLTVLAEWRADVLATGQAADGDDSDTPAVAVWSQAGVYDADQLVVHSAALYLALVAAGGTDDGAPVNPEPGSGGVADGVWQLIGPNPDTPTASTSWRGPWNADTDYQPGDVTIDDDRLFLRVGTGGIHGTAPQHATALWDPLTTFTGTFDTAATYHLGQIAWDGTEADFYIARTNIPSGGRRPGLASNQWRRLSPTNAHWFGPWQPESYGAGAFTTHADEIWVAVADTTGNDIPGHSASWEQISPTQGRWRGNWSPADTYDAGDLTLASQTVYVANQQVGPSNVGPAGDPDHWDPISDYRGTWSAARSYTTGNIVARGATGLYLARRLVLSGREPPEANTADWRPIASIDAADWAADGNTDLVPLDKLPALTAGGGDSMTIRYAGQTVPVAFPAARAPGTSSDTDTGTAGPMSKTQAAHLASIEAGAQVNVPQRPPTLQQVGSDFTTSAGQAEGAVSTWLGTSFNAAQLTAGDLFVIHGEPDDSPRIHHLQTWPTLETHAAGGTTAGGHAVALTGHVDTAAGGGEVDVEVVYLARDAAGNLLVRIVPIGSHSTQPLTFSIERLT